MAASSSNSSRYPHRLYEEGKSPLQQRSMNHNCFRSRIGMLKEGLGLDVWDELKKSSLGVFIKFAELEYTWCAHNVHFFLTHQLGVNNLHEIWSLIDGRPLRFSLNEFAHITGLNCDPFDKSDNFDGDHKEFWKEMNIKTTSDGPMFNELLKVIDCSSTWNKEKRLMVGRLCLLAVCVHGVHHGSRIPLSTAKRVLDPVAFEKYPWGRVAFSCLVDSVKVVDYEKDSYTIRGCVHAMLIWVYESVPGLGEGFGRRREEISGVPLLDWQSCRKRINFPEFIEKEKKLHGQVRVRYMIPFSEENMYPKWCDTEENKDPALDNLIVDIIHNRLPANAWEGENTVCSPKKKLKVRDDEDGNTISRHKKNKIKEAHYNGEEGANVTKKKEKIDKEHMEDAEDEKKSLLDICKMMDKMNGTISDLGKNLSIRMDALEVKFESLVDQKMRVLEEKLGEKIEAVERAVKETKESNPNVVPHDATSKNNKDDEGNSKAPSWMVEMNQTSQDEFPVQRVVKKVNTVIKKMKKESDISEDVPLPEKKVFANVEKKKATVVEDSPKNNKRKKKRPEHVNADVEDITDQVLAANTKMASSSEGTWDNQREQLASKVLGKSLAALGDAIKGLDGGPVQAKRVPQLAETQKYPFVGNSTVKRIITDIIPSNPTEDHLKPAEDVKFQKLTDFLMLDNEAPLLTSNPDTRFYWQIMTPRSEWPSQTYGWLKDHHMGAAMTMFRKRLVSNPIRYPKQRITFLDQDFMTTLSKDYLQFEPSPKNFLFRDFYVNHVNGTNPIGPATNKKWYIDIDNLYGCLFVNANHWVALDIDLPARKIYVYDSIPNLVEDEKMVEHCMFLRRMIPALLSAVIPDQYRKKSYAMLGVKRVRNNVPLNEDPGDCGIFAIKYIECLALKKSFDGIRDENMPALRVKLATELFDEVGEELGHRIAHTYPPAKDFVIPHLTDSH